MRVVDANWKTQVDLLIKLINEQNKFCYICVVNRNQNSESASMIHLIMSLLQRHESTLDQSDSIDQKESATRADNDWSHHSIVSLLEWHSKSNSVTNLSLFASSMIYLYSQHWRQQQDDIYCRQNETCTIYLERIEHILHV